MTRSAIAGLVAGLAASAPCFLEPAAPAHEPLRRAEDRFRAVAARATRHYNETVSAPAKEVIQVLQGKALEAFEKGDLRESFRLDGILKRYQAIAAGRNLMVPASGLYSATHSEWGEAELFLRPNGTVTWPGADGLEDHEGTWSLEDGELRIRWESQEEALSAVPTFRGTGLTLSWKSAGPGAFGWDKLWPEGTDIEKLLGIDPATRKAAADDASVDPVE